MKKVFLSLLVLVALVLTGQTFGAEHDGHSKAVMLQGFHWESHMSYPWWDVIAGNAQDIANGGFDMVWFPPSQDSGSDEGYLPRKLYVQSGPYGNETQLKNAIYQLHQKNVKAIADIVINHRVGTSGWGDFTEPAWGTDSVTSDDEWSMSSGAPDTGAPYAAARDIDHTKSYVQSSIIDWMKWLKSSIGYDGWRYDYTKGYSGYYNGIYNDATSPFMSVAETWPDITGDYYASGQNINYHKQILSDWVNAAGGKSAVFDFTTKWQLMLAVDRNEYWRLKNSDGKAIGFIGWWPAKAVTFLDNHDTGASPGGGQNHWPFPGDKVMQGYAYILTHPGIPSVYWVHYYDWGLKTQINKLISIRKTQGINSESSLNIVSADSSKYAAIIDNKVAVKIGSGDWNPGSDWNIAANGNNYAVWTKGSTTNTNIIVTNMVRTVVFMFKETVSGQDIFIKGGHDAGLVPSVYPSMSENIKYLNTKNTTTASIKANDQSLDWSTESALDWTTSLWPADWGTKKTYVNDGFGEDPENKWGNHWWKFDVNMQGKTGEWFEFKAFLRQGSSQSWENDIIQAGTPQASINHWGKKGYITRVRFGEGWVEFLPLNVTPNQAPVASLGAIPVNIQEGQTVNFDGSASSDPEDGAAVEVRWDYEGDGVYDTTWSTTKTIAHVYNTAGTYQATLQVRDSKGLTDSKSLTITVSPKPNTPPQALFSISPNPAWTGDTVTLDASASTDTEDGANIQVRWDFEGDGTFDTAYSYTKTITHVYLTAGVYSPKLEVMDSKAAVSTVTHPITINLKQNTPPVAELTSNPANGTTATLFTLDASGSTDAEDGKALQFRFDWENDGTWDTTWSTTPSATHTWSTTGLKTVKVEVKDSGDATATKTVSIQVDQNTVPILKIYYKKPSTWTTPYMHYWATTPDALSSTWPGKKMISVGNDWYYLALTNQTSSKIVFNNNGSPQSADLTRTGDGWYKDGVWYNSNPDDNVPPTTTLTAPTAGQTLVGNVTLTATASDNVGVTKVEFYYDDKLIGEDLTAPYSLVWNTATISSGSHTIKSKAYDAAGNSTFSSPVSAITANPNTPPVANAGGNITGYVGVPVEFNGSASYDPNGTIVSYLWSNGLSGERPTKTYTQTGTFQVTLTVKDNEGASASDTITLTITTNIPTTRGDFREETIYFLMTARFNDGDPANNRPSRAYVTSGNAANNDPAWRGDFKGLIEKLDYIKALGFSAVWITPVVLNRSDYDYHGYHAWDFNKVDARLESPGYDYQRLINEIHARGMKVIQDIVLNHTSRYGAKGLYTVKYWGDSNDPEWGDGTAIDYYDKYNPNFEYNGLDYEPISGKSYYNGDLWTKDKPNLSWSDLPGWGQPTQWRSPEGYKIYNYQWPNLTLFPNDKFHPDFLKNWEDYTCQVGSIHEDCIDLNTENAAVQQFLINAYNRYIDMGVDSFRIDTVKHISRLMFNRHFIPAFKARGGENFFMFGEVCTRVNEIWNHNVAPLSTPFYTWKERGTFSSDDEVAALEAYNYENNLGTGSQPSSGNHYLDGNNYHTPDYSKASGMSVIDFPMHWNFGTAGQAFNMHSQDWAYNDATWNVVYVDSHDYGPNTDNRYTGSESECAENYSLMFTFRGIPCVYYGSEIQFKKGARTDVGPNGPIENTGRAYFGNYLQGSVSVQDFGVWNNATGEMANTLNHPLAKHLARLNRIRRAIPALQKGQYSTDNVSGWMAYKKRFTQGNVDSFALITVSGDATFSGIPNGTYKDAITGDIKVVSNGTLTANCSGQGNLRVYVLDLPGNPAPGKIGNDTLYLH